MAQQNVALDWQIGNEVYENSSLTSSYRQSIHSSTREMDGSHLEVNPAIYARSAGQQAHDIQPRQVPPVANHQANVDKAERRLVILLVRWLLCAMVGVAMVGGYAISPQEQEQILAHHAVDGWLVAEEQAWQNDAQERLGLLIDQNVNRNWRRNWLNFWSVDLDERDTLETVLKQVDLHDNLLEAEVVVSRASAEWWRSSPYREHRFYKIGADGLIRTIPDEAFWGTKDSIDTAYIRLEFYEPDAALAAKIGPQLDAYYLHVYDRLGLVPNVPHDGEDEKLTFLLDYDAPRGWGNSGRRQAVTSPLLSRVPSALSDEEFILHQIVGGLSFFALARAVSESNDRNLYRWETIVWALDGWLQTDALQQRTPWNLQAETLLRENPPTERPLQLAAVGEWRSRGIPQQELIMRQYTMSESIIDYIVVTYGRESIPRLLVGLPKHNNWPDLVRAVYDADFEEFESGWNAYLAERFGWAD
ncbi:MAG: hypothetical protein AAF702_35335 [Chloroflexota bacterium]